MKRLGSIPARVDKQECATPGSARMGWPTAEFFVDVIFSTTHALLVFWRVLPRALGRAYITMSVPSTCSHTALRQEARFSEKR